MLVLNGIKEQQREDIPKTVIRINLFFPLHTASTGANRDPSIDFGMFSAQAQVRHPFMITWKRNPDSKSIFHNDGQCKLLNSFGRDDEIK